MSENKKKKIVKQFPKNNTPFKNLFKTEVNKNLMINLLNEIIKFENDPIVNIQYIEDKEFPPERANNNYTSFVAVTKTKELINVDIQVQNTDNMYKRSLFNVSDIIYHSLPKSKNYKEIPNTILIIFLHHDITKNENKFHWCFSFHDKETKTEEGFEEILNIHLIELSKFERLYNQGKLNENNPWFLFLIDPNNDYFLNNETPLKFIQARETLLSLERNDNYIRICEKEEELYNDYLNGLINQKIEGFIEGYKKGYKNGIKEGKIVNKIITTIKLIQNGNDIELIKSLTNFNNSQITEINNFLTQTDYSIERLATIFEVDTNKLIKEYENCENEYKINNMNNNHS